MAEGVNGEGSAPGLDVLLLAGRLGLDDDGWPLAPLVDRLAARGIAPRVLCASRGRQEDDARFVAMPALGHRWLKFLAARRLPRDAEFKRPRVLHAVHQEMASTALALAESWGVPYVQTVDDFPVLEEGLRVSRRWLAALVVPSGELAEALVETARAPVDRVMVIPPGIVAEPPLPRGGGWELPVIGAAGPPLEETGFATFLDAARIVLANGRDVEFLIAGQGGEATELRRRTLALGIQERVTVADLPVVGERFWSVLDLYCQPSLVPSTGRTLGLALVRGIPSVASNVQGLRGMIQAGRSGMLAAPGDPSALASAVMHLIDNPEHALELGGRARERTLARFNLDAEADRLAALYRRCAAVPAEA